MLALPLHQGKPWRLSVGTGSGKSTLIQLIPRFYDVSEGQVLVDGVDVRDYSLTTLRNKIGFIHSKSVAIYRDDRRETYAYGKEDATQAELERAAEIAQAADFISRTPDGFDAHLAEGGTNFSGGQKQRLAIARSGDPPTRDLYF